MADHSSEDSDGSEVTHLLQSYPVPAGRMRDWRLFNVVLLGVTFLFLFTALQTCSMVEVCDGAFSLSLGSAYTSGSQRNILFPVGKFYANHITKTKPNPSPNTNTDPNPVYAANITNSTKPY